MRITAIETIHVGAYPNITFVEVHTDEGLIGLGETFRTPKTVAAQIHETVAPYLLGKDPLTIDAHSSVLLNPYLGFASTSAEIRAASAVDIALWDLWGKTLDRPRSEEHTSELQSQSNLVCRLLLEKENTQTRRIQHQRNLRALPPTHHPAHQSPRAVPHFQRLAVPTTLVSSLPHALVAPLPQLFDN